MPATVEISEPLVREHIVRAVVDVFKTMLEQPVTLGEADRGWPPTPPPEPALATPQVVGTVGFLGEMNGLIYLYFDVGFAQTCTGVMLGMSEDEATEDVVNDAIGELTNMIVGSFKNGLCDAGFPCKLTLPSILRGTNFSVEPVSTARRYLYAFNTSGRRIVADILMTTEQ